jgi:GNAT superfamily N-acetyltransferase
MPIIVRLASTDELIDLRHAVLRQGLPRPAACFEGDDEPTTHHFAALEPDSGPAILGCATILRRDWQGHPAWQLRGMAVTPTHQHQGIGRIMLSAIEDHIRADNATGRLWCNARVPAIGFYTAHGWLVVSDVFVIETAGPHVRMTKLLYDTPPFE